MFDLIDYVIELNKCQPVIHNADVKPFGQLHGPGRQKKVLRLLSQI